MMGPVWASKVPGGDRLVDAFVAAATGNGVPEVEDFNTGEQEGVGYYQLSTRRGLRCSAAVAYLKPARGRPTCTSRRRPMPGVCCSATGGRPGWNTVRAAPC